VKALVQDANDLTTNEDIWCPYDRVEIRIPALFRSLFRKWAIESLGSNGLQYAEGAKSTGLEVEVVDLL
jgi:hypothetical protein